MIAGTVRMGRCYRFGRHQPVVVVQLTYIMGKGSPLKDNPFTRGRAPGYVYIKGYPPKRYEEYQKWYTVPNAAKKDYRTQAEIEGLTEAPEPVEFRVRPTSKVVEIEL